MVTPILDTLLGSVGRFLEHLYLENAGWLSLVVLAWMAVVAVGRHTVHSVRVALRRAITEDGDQRADLTAEQLLVHLRPRYQAACAEHRFMPTQRGLWVTRCTAEKLRTHAGFTAEGLTELMLAVTPPVKAQPGPLVRRSTANTPRARGRIGGH